MNYYKRHIGDYAKKAGHLSILEHGVYTLLMDAYYDREQAPTRQEAVRISRARTPDELAALDAVLSDFFVETDGRYVQARIEEEFIKAETQAIANQENGKRGGRPRKPKGETKKAKENQTETHSVSDGNQNNNENNPNPPIHQSTNLKAKEKAKALSAPEVKKLNLEIDLPDCIPREVWSQFVEHRCSVKAAMTEYAAILTVKQLENLWFKGHDPTELMETSMRNGWKKIVEPEGRNHANNNSSGNKSSVVERVAAKVAALERNTGHFEGQAITVIAR